MFNTSESSKNCEKLYNKIALREQLEKQAAGALTADTLARLNVSVEALPQRCQQLLQQVASDQAALGIDKLDSHCLTLGRSMELSELLEEEYEVLKLEQKNAELQAKIDGNEKFLEGMRRELKNSRAALTGPVAVQDCVRQLGQKMTLYEETCDKLTAQFSKLSVPDAILLPALRSLAAERDALLEEARALREQAEEVECVRRARLAFTKLKK